MERKMTQKANIGGVIIGGRFPIAVQSMNCTDTRDVCSTVDQIKRLSEAGCELTRVAIPDREAALALSSIVSQSPIPVIADIHFDYRLALLSIESGAAKIRMNPGNIGDESQIREIALAAKARGIPIRVGVNSGSVAASLIREFKGVNCESMTQSALQAIQMLERHHFYDIVVSIKSSDPLMTIQSYRLLSQKTPYPLHVGVTEAGTPSEGAIRSAVGIGTLLAEGIGDTIRVSLTGDPVDEVRAAYSILRSLSLRRKGITLISCPTCGRTKVPLVQIAQEVENMIRDLPYDLKIAVMGCAVNGPGEAREADIGIAGGDGEFLLFKKGETIRKISQDRVLEELMKEIHEMGKSNSKENK
jgi:(E)-4-hydroxy-3-methylbut-2-enyl-diphosphate synthase